jgi:hypothetical protein
MWLSMACIVTGDSRYWRGARCCLCDRVMRCLGTTILKPTGSRRALSLYTERWRLVHFPFKVCAHLVAGRANGKGGFARSYTSNSWECIDNGHPTASGIEHMPCSFCPGRGVLVVLNEHHFGVVHQPLIAVVKPGVSSILLLDELVWRSKRTCLPPLLMSCIHDNIAVVAAMTSQ